MAAGANKSKKRLIWTFIIFCVVCVGMCMRVGWIQIVKGEEYTKLAVEQQTKDVPIEAKRGEITDRNGKELAVSTIRYSVWARPASVKSGSTDEEKTENLERTIKVLSAILDMDKEEVKEKVTKNQALVKIDKYLSREKEDQIRDAELPGIELSQDVKRYYPLDNFAAHLLGSVTDDNYGLSGLELQYDQYLRGVAGRWIKNTDASGNTLSYGGEKYYEAEDGVNLELTIDEVIQHYVEKSIKTVQKNTSADRVMCMVMDPKTGEILAMSVTPDFDPNDPRVPLDNSEAAKVEKMSSSEKIKYWNAMWRNPLVSDTYEPGSTFKLLTTSIALEEGIAETSDRFNCAPVKVGSETLKCWRHPNSHGEQDLTEAVGNSCNPVFVKLAQRIGIDKYYDYMSLFGITEKTGVDYPGEGTAILQGKESAGLVGLSTMGYGHGIAVTPVQLLTAISALGNEGKIMEPHLVKKLTDEKGRTVKEFEPKIVRQVVSEETAEELCLIMESVVAEGGGGTAKLAGYRIGGKTGTANKVRESGGYSDETYSSFLGMAPMDDPQIALLVVVDNPKGIKFGSQTAAPGAKKIFEDTLRYMGVKTSYTKEEKQKEESKTTVVPDVTGENFSEAIGILGGSELKYKVSPATNSDKDFVIKDQYPKAGERINVKGTVYLYRE